MEVAITVAGIIQVGPGPDMTLEHFDTAIDIEPALTPEGLIELRRAVDQTYVDERVKGYIVDVIHATRRPAELDGGLDPLIQFGASPRGTIALLRASKARRWG